MSRELWATYSVKDHLRPRAFAADVMLYDRLVLPVPPPGDASEWTRWEENGWDPERQAKLLEVLNPVVRAVPWDDEHRGGWQQQMNKAEQDAVQIPNYAFYATGPSS